MMEQNIKIFLGNEYKKLNKSNHQANSNVLYNIISIKVKKGLQSYHRSLYLDVKQFINEYPLAELNQRMLNPSYRFSIY